MQPQDPLSNNSDSSSNDQLPQGPGSPTFQIPRSEPPQAAPAPAPQVPQPVVYDAPPVNRNDLPPQPDRHKQPIFMEEDISDMPLPFTKSGTASSAPVDPYASAPKPQAPVQNQIPRPAPIQQPILPTTLPSKPSRQSSFAKYIAAGVVVLLIAGLLVWGVSSLVGNKEPEKTAVTKPAHKEFTSENLGFATAYPEGWTHEEGRKNGLDLVRFAHPKIRENNTATAEVAILRLTSEQLKGISDQAQFFETYTKTIADGFSSYSEISAAELTIDELPAKKVEADIVQNGENDRAIFYLVYAQQNGFIIVTSADKSQYSDLKSSLEVFVDRFENQIVPETPASEESSE